MALLADEILANLLSEKLETANDKQAAILETLSANIISPLFEQHLPEVLNAALQPEVLNAALQPEVLKRALHGLELTPTVRGSGRLGRSCDSRRKEWGWRRAGWGGRGEGSEWS